MSAPLFVTGPARSGTTLLARMLGAHPQIDLAVDPYLPLFRSLRDAILRERGLPVDPAAPLQDYYFDEGALAALDAVQEADLDLPLDPAELPALRERVAVRAAHESPALAARGSELAGSSYRELFGGALRLIGGAAYAGWKEVWTVEFLAPLARTYPDARFVVVLRDPRAMLASLAAIGAREPDQAAHAPSYLRHWRKHVALLERYRHDPQLAGRTCLVLYEQLVAEPERHATELCAFLGLPYEPRMLALGGWTGNAASRRPLNGVSAERSAAPALPAGALQLVGLACDPELGLLGYEQEGPARDAVLPYLVEAARGVYSWRSDLAEPERDLELELRRRALHGGAPPADPTELRRHFLTEEAHAALR